MTPPVDLDALHDEALALDAVHTREAWLASLPDNVLEVARRFPPGVCYRSTKDPGHYMLNSYGELLDSSVVVQIVHGRDSYLPGVLAFGVDPATLVKCECGAWEWPTQEQADRSRAEITARFCKLPGRPS